MIPKRCPAFPAFLSACFPRLRAALSARNSVNWTGNGKSEGTLELGSPALQSESKWLRGAQTVQGVEPGTHLSISSTSDIVHVTLAYAAVTTALTSLLEWRELVSGAGGNAYTRQLAAADSSSVHTVVDNKLGVGAQLQLDFGDRV